MLWVVHGRSFVSKTLIRHKTLCYSLDIPSLKRSYIIENQYCYYLSTANMCVYTCISDKIINHTQSESAALSPALKKYYNCRYFKCTVMQFWSSLHIISFLFYNYSPMIIFFTILYVHNYFVIQNLKVIGGQKSVTF